MSDMTPERGAHNLLRNCAHARDGDRLLIAYEPAEHGYFDADAVGIVTRAAQAIGLDVHVFDVGFNPNEPHLTPDLLAQFEAADIILFLARLGDQLRFSDMPQGKKIIVSFAMTRELFGSGFSNGHHDAFLALKTEVNTVLDAADEVQITCPLGTQITGRPVMNLDPDGDTTVMRFPMSIFTPVAAHSFSGRAALKFLTGTGSKYYDDYTIEFDQPVFALMENGRLTGFEGFAPDVARANAQYDRVANLFGIDRDFVHSWHAGIHPGCGYPWDMHDNWERWGGAAFGNPRILHFHTCGAYAPGEISWNIFDASISIDGIRYWDQGVFRADRLPNGSGILSQYPCAAGLFAMPEQDIGFLKAG
ncbi:MAG: hypothetical protein ABJI96_13345 [Paracoccaceae bacterium]